MKLKSSIEKTSYFMKIAFAEAIKAKNRDEVPVGSVIVDERNNIIASNGNRIIELSDPTAHAEILCIREASKKIQSERLVNCSLFSTLEPCAMCASAISFARIKNLYFGAFDPKGGAVENGIKFFNSDTCNHKQDVYGGFSEKKSSDLLKSYFTLKRD